MISPKREGNIGELLKKALTKLHQNDHFDEYMRYLNSEWYYTPDDLRRAREDERVWAELKFPGRLKIEISSLLDESFVEPAEESHEVSSKVQFSEEINTTTTYDNTDSTFDNATYDAASPENDEAEYNSWVKCWAPEHESYYFYNTVTQASSWEDPYGADETAVYDVYQYNEDTQEWVVIEDNTSAYNYEVDADGNYLYTYDDTTTTAEAKNEDYTSYDEKQSPYEGGATFTRPRDPNSEADVLFTMSPNRPGAKGGAVRRNESKATYRYSGRGGVIGGRGIPSPSGSPVPARKSKPVRLDVTHLSDDSGSDKDLPAKPRSAVKNGAKNGASVSLIGVTSADKNGNKNGNKSGEKNRDSKKGPTATTDFQYVTPRPGAAEEDTAPERHRSSSLDSDVEYPVRHVYGAYAETRPLPALPGEEESEEVYGGSYDYNDASAKTYYDNTSDRYYHDSKDSADEAYDHYAGVGVTSNKTATTHTNKSNKSNATKSSKFSEYGYDGDFSTAASSKREEEVLEQSYYHHAAEPTAPQTPNEGTSARDSPTDSVHIVGLPPVAPSPMLYTPNGRTRRYSNDEKSSTRSTNVTYATPVRDGDPTTTDDYYLYATSVDEFPKTPGGTNNLSLMEVAMGTPVSNHPTPHSARSPRSSERKPKSTLSKLFHMNLFSKGPKAPATPPPPRDNSRDSDRTAATNPHSSAYRAARQEERRLNKQKSNNSDITITEESYKNTNPGNKMRPFPSTTASNPNTAQNSDYYTAAHTGDRHDLGMRRKPAPASSDAAASVASNEKFHSQHGNEKQYKYQNKQKQLNERNHNNSGSTRTGTNAAQEETHLKNLQQLLDMGFEEGESIMALNMCDDNLTEATQMLVESRVTL